MAARPRSLAVLSTLLLLSNCGICPGALGELRQYVARPAREYPNAQTKGGVTVAVEPLTDAKVLDGYFRTDLLSRGFLPLLLVVENGTPNSSVIVLKDEVLLSRHGAEGTFAPPAKVHSGRSPGGTALGVGGAAAMVAGSLVAAPPLLIAAAYSKAKALEVKQALVKNELRTETLLPGHALCGFVYFPIGKGENAWVKSRVRLSVLAVPEQDKISFEFDLPDIPRRR